VILHYRSSAAFDSENVSQLENHILGRRPATQLTSQLHTNHLPPDIQYNTIICNTCMVGRRAESGVWAIARGEDGEASLKESTERIIRLKVRLRRGKR